MLSNLYIAFELAVGAAVVAWLLIRRQETPS